MDDSLLKIRRERNKKDFPYLPLEDDEYVEVVIKRAQICLTMLVVSISAVLCLLLLICLFIVVNASMLDQTSLNFVFIILFSLFITTVLAGFIAIMIFRGNIMFITNKHAIQRVMNSPVSTSINVIDLCSVEDASFHKNGFLQTIFSYGTLRLATVGDETTYTFKHSDISPEHLKYITELISKAKKRSRNHPATQGA